MNLDDRELQRMIALQRNHVLCGSHEVQGILYAFKAELMRRSTSSSFSADDYALI